MVKAHFFDILLTKHRTGSAGVIPNCASERSEECWKHVGSFFASRARRFRDLANVTDSFQLWIDAETSSAWQHGGAAFLTGLPRRHSSARNDEYFSAVTLTSFVVQSHGFNCGTGSAGVIPNCASERRHKAKTTLFAVPFFASRARRFRDLSNDTDSSHSWTDPESSSGWQYGDCFVQSLGTRTSFVKFPLRSLCGCRSAALFHYVPCKKHVKRNSLTCFSIQSAI